MKRLIFLSICITLLSCKVKQKVARKNAATNPYKWTVVITNGKQAIASDMTQTTYVFLTNGKSKDSLCNGTSLISETVYKEFGRNDHTIENPVWSIPNQNITTLKARQVLDIVCGNENATFGRGSVHKFPSTLNNYQEFKEALK